MIAQRLEQLQAKAKKAGWQGCKGRQKEPCTVLHLSADNEGNQPEKTFLKPLVWAAFGLT